MDPHVWRVDLRQPSAWVEEAAGRWLTPDERQRGRRGRPEVRRRRLVSSIGLRVALARRLGCSPAALRFMRAVHGKPGLVAGGTSGRVLHFNLTRSGDCCLIALSETGPVGVDVERVVPILDLESVSFARFAAEEATSIMGARGEQRLRSFYTCWTLKEAYLKATGAGLSADLARVVVSTDEHRRRLVSLPDDDPSAWRVLAVDPGPGLIGAVVYRGLGPAHAGPLVPPGLDLGASQLASPLLATAG